jgi:phosphoribosylcarboxyaminoimidazole (NCAIR) mutase
MIVSGSTDALASWIAARSVQGPVLAIPVAQIALPGLPSVPSVVELTV